MNSPVRTAAACAMVALFSGGAVVQAQVGPDGFDWATIGAPGNRGYDNIGGPRIEGRGAVGYEYRLARTEITTSQWIEYVNTFSARSDPVGAVANDLPLLWGAERDGSYTGPGVRYRPKSLPGAANFPVSGIDWRQCAMYVNWLNNDKSNSPSAIRNGAYDVSTFGNINNNPYLWTDQAAHNSGARYWIPTYDEWLKGAHYSPQNGGRWNLYSNGTDTSWTYGVPGVGQVNSGFQLTPPFAEYNIPVGSYPTSLSPWGLLDTAGSVTEWTEGIFMATGPTEFFRMTGGSYAGEGPISADDEDRAYGFSTFEPSSPFYGVGFRVASSVPSSGTALILASASAGLCIRRRRRPS